MRNTKGIIVADIRKKCKQCEYYQTVIDLSVGRIGRCRIANTMPIIDSSKKPDWCPIKAIKRKTKSSRYALTPTLEGKYQTEYERGWNDCVEEILKGE